MRARMENEEPESEQIDFTRPAYEFKPNEHHDWRQQGPFLICKSCELQHAVFIGNHKILMGLEEDGKPILKRKTEVFGSR